MSFFRTLSAEKRRRLMFGLGSVAGVLLITLSVFASNGWLPNTDPMTGKKTGWFGRDLPKHATSDWSPFPPPNPTPQLSKEYIYAGSRLLAVEDANAVAAAPADLAVWTPSNGVWAVKGQAGSQATTFQFGMTGDTPVPGDYDGDGKTDFAVYRPGDPTIFYVWRSGAENYYGVGWGNLNDKATSADFDGDGLSDPAIARSEGGSLTWWITTSSNSSHFAIAWGHPSHKLAPADYDGDGKADVTVFDPVTKGFFIFNSSNLTVSEVYFPVDGTIVSSDYDGDGKADPAVFVSSSATWYIRQSTTNSIVSTVWGNNGSSGCTSTCDDYLKPVQNDYDGDGKTDFAVFDNSISPPGLAVWTIKRSSNGTTRTESFGLSGDFPVPAFYRR